MVTLRQLRYFASLARHRHFGQAAEACAVTQPALSMQIRELETELGLDLVERRPGEVVLTDTGVEIASRAEGVLSATRDLVEFARSRGRALGGRLHLGVIPSLAPYVLPRVLPAIQRRYPDLEIELRETQTRQLVSELAQGSLDLVMMALPVAEADVETHELFDDPFLLAVPAGDPRPARARVSGDDIDRERLILLEEGHCLRDQALAYCTRGRGVGPMGLGATSLATVMQMVANGYGVTLVPQVAVGVEVRDPRIRLLRFADPEPGRKVGLVWRRTSPRKSDFLALGAVIVAALGIARGRPRAPRPRVSQSEASRSRTARFSRQ
jgi:LysR family hydrogen peroxide-inducible transcriptional activator